MFFAGYSWWGGGGIKANSFWHYNTNLWCSGSPCSTRFEISSVAFFSLWGFMSPCSCPNSFSSCSDKNHGVILLPEGLIESIPEVYALLKVTCANFFFSLPHVTTFQWRFSFFVFYSRIIIPLGDAFDFHSLEKQFFFLWLFLVVLALVYNFICSYWSLFPCRKFMVCTGKEYLPIKFLLNFHLGHLRCLNSCHHSSRNRLQLRCLSWGFQKKKGTLLWLSFSWSRWIGSIVFFFFLAGTTFAWIRWLCTTIPGNWLHI